MKLEQKKQEQLQEQHLDDLIRLAFQQEEAAETQAILAAFDSLPEDAADVDEVTRQRTFDRALEKLDRLQAAQKRTQRRRWMARFGEVAAVILVLLAIAAPIAVANIEALRTTFARFFLADNARPGDLLLDYYVEVNPDFPYLHDPNQWGGLYLPADVPEGYEVAVCHVEGTTHYLGLKHDTTGDLLRLTESVEELPPLAEVRESRLVQLKTGQARVEKTAGGDTVLTWRNAQRWYRLCSSVLTEAELLKMAGSVSPVAGQEAFDRLMAGSVPGAAIPKGYAGNFFPTWLPEAYPCTKVTQWGGACGARFLPDGRTGWSWEELSGDTSLLDSDGGVPQEVDISGCPGILYRNGDAATIVWMNEMCMFTVKGWGMTDETLLRIARSVRMIDRDSAQESIAAPTPVPTSTPAPQPALTDWPLPFVPTWCPEACLGPYIATPYSDKAALLVYPLSSQDELSLQVTEAGFVNKDYSEYLTRVKVDVNGCEGEMTFSPMGAGNLLLTWQQDGYAFIVTGDGWQADRMLQLARSVRRGTPQELAASAAKNTASAAETPCAPLRFFPMALLPDMTDFRENHVLDDMTSLSFRLKTNGHYATLIQFSDDAELLTEGGTSFNVTRAEVMIGERQVTVYTPVEGGADVAPIVLTWPEEQGWYMLLSYSCTHEELYGIVSQLAPVEDAGAIPTPVPTATPEPPNLTVVPPQWQGEHFLMRVPAGFAFVSADADRAVWRNAAGNEFVFEALPEDWSLEEERAQGSDAWESDFQGRWAVTFTRFSQDDFCRTNRFIFPVDERWYAIESWLTYDFYANYVEKIE